MTDRLAALELLVDEESPARTAALAHFYDTFCSQPLAMLKWLYVQVRGILSHVLDCVGRFFGVVVAVLMCVMGGCRVGLYNFVDSCLCCYERQYFAGVRCSRSWVMGRTLPNGTTRFQTLHMGAGWHAASLLWPQCPA